ncbi:HNH endonuclease signature motif containing protein [Citrobacter arsenatis]|uniref:HNH endonuclease n=1 Tax=Citrobacter arsenatis TaxID=2546350 RepID=UPI00300DD6D4
MTKLTKKQRAVIREKFGGKCAYCGCELPERWHADHVVPVVRKLKAVKTGHHTYKLVSTGEMHYPENDKLENMYPACVECNLYKHAASVECFRKMIVDGFRGAVNRSQSLRCAQRFGMLTVTPAADADVIFWFEKYQAEKESAR